MSGFTRAEKKEVSGAHDEYAKLLCSEPRCGRRWSVNMGKPLCSLHAWGSAADETASPLDAIDPFDDCGGTIQKGDPKAWAKRLVYMHGKGMNVRPISLKMAFSALKISRAAA